MLRQKVILNALVVGIFAEMTCCVAWHQQQYAVSQSFPLHQATEGLAGTLQLLMDSRLTPDVRGEMWGKGDWSVVLSPDAKLFQEFSKVPPAYAKLQIRSEAGQLVSERILGVALAQIQEVNFDGENNRTFLLTVDSSVGFGSDAGLETTLLQIHDGTFRGVFAEAEGTRKSEPFRLVKTLKADWKMVSSSEKPEILSFSCRPAQDGSFVVVYVRYYFERGEWFAKQRERPGFWESDQGFPPRSEFP